MPSHVEKIYSITLLRKVDAHFVSFRFGHEKARYLLAFLGVKGKSRTHIIPLGKPTLPASRRARMCMWVFSSFRERADNHDVEFDSFPTNGLLVCQEPTTDHSRSVRPERQAPSTTSSV